MQTRKCPDPWSLGSSVRRALFWQRKVVGPGQVWLRSCLIHLKNKNQKDQTISIFINCISKCASKTLKGKTYTGLSRTKSAVFRTQIKMTRQAEKQRNVPFFWTDPTDVGLSRQRCWGCIECKKWGIDIEAKSRYQRWQPQWRDENYRVEHATPRERAGAWRQKEEKQVGNPRTAESKEAVPVSTAPRSLTWQWEPIHGSVKEHSGVQKQTH